MESLIREIDAEALPELLEVEFLADLREVDNGIGAYEFWGQGGNDVQMGVKCEEVYWNKKAYSDIENAIIEKYLDDNFESITREFEELY